MGHTTTDRHYHSLHKSDHHSHRDHHREQAASLGLASIPFKRTKPPSVFDQAMLSNGHHETSDSPHCSILVPPQDHHSDTAWVRGNPGPFGLLCFGMTTDMLMFILTGWSEKTFLPTVFVYAAFYGGFGQFVAGILELIKGNTFGGTAFASYGCFWMGWFLLEYLMMSDPTTYMLAMTGKTLWCGLWAMLTFGFFIVTLRKNHGLQAVFATLVITFILLGGGVHNPTAEKAGGYMGFLCGTIAIYTAFAELYRDELGIHLPGIEPSHII